ncbi:hypothetical protein D3C71_1870940 [compost metagenome]
MGHDQVVDDGAHLGKPGAKPVAGLQAGIGAFDEQRGLAGLQFVATHAGVQAQGLGIQRQRRAGECAAGIGHGGLAHEGVHGISLLHLASPTVAQATAMRGSGGKRGRRFTGWA